MTTREFLRHHVRPLVVLLVVFAVLVMAAYPASLAAIDQVANPNGAVGSPLVCNGTVVGSKLVAENVSSPLFFHPRSASASDSGVDPDIPPSDAFGQVASVSNATGISTSVLDYLVQENINSNQAENGFLAPDYVDVNALNVELIQLYPTVYAGFCPG